MTYPAPVVDQNNAPLGHFFWGPSTYTSLGEDFILEGKYTIVTFIPTQEGDIYQDQFSLIFLMTPYIVVALTEDYNDLPEGPRQRTFLVIEKESRGKNGENPQLVINTLAKRTRKKLWQFLVQEENRSSHHTEALIGALT